MIAIPKPSSNASTIGHRNAPRDVAWHEQFLDLLPAIRRHALVSFQHLQREARAEAVQDVVAYALVAFVRLLQFGRGEIAYAAPLAGFGVARVRDGRRVGTSVNVLDVTSRRCQLRKHVRVESLDVRDKSAGGWQEVLVEDRSASPADTAAARIDFRDWLSSLSPHHRQIALMLASGEKTQDVARKFRITSGRISQLRRELQDDWRNFQGEPTGLTPAPRQRLAR